MRVFLFGKVKIPALSLQTAQGQGTGHPPWIGNGARIRVHYFPLTMEANITSRARAKITPYNTELEPCLRSESRRRNPVDKDTITEATLDLDISDLEHSFS